MNTSLKWIKALVPGLDCGVQEYVDAMTLSGSKVEGYEQLDADLDKIVVGQVTKIEKHPDADKLVICQVNVGSETLQIVTGAPNVFEGAKVPVVLDGGRVAGLLVVLWKLNFGSIVLTASFGLSAIRLMPVTIH